MKIDWFHLNFSFFHLVFSFFVRISRLFFGKILRVAAVTLLMILGIPVFIIIFPAMCALCSFGENIAAEEWELRYFYHTLFSWNFWSDLYGIRRNKSETESGGQE